MSSSFEKINTLTDTFVSSSRSSVETLIGVVDEVLLSVGLILLGWLLGYYAKKAIEKIGQKIKLSRFLQKVGLNHLLEKSNIKTSPSELIGKFVSGYILTIFVISAANLLGFTQISTFLDDVIHYIPNILIALVIVLFGTRIADTTRAILENTLKMTRSRAATTLALTARYIIVTFSVLAALFQLKIAAELVQILFTGFIAMIALSGGLAFGLGGKDIIREFLEDMKHAPTVKSKKSIRSKDL